MSSIERLIGSPRSIGARKFRQVVASSLHYIHELKQCRSPRDVAAWAYYKAPNAFPLRRYPAVVNMN